MGIQPWHKVSCCWRGLIKDGSGWESGLSDLSLRKNHRRVNMANSETAEGFKFKRVSEEYRKVVASLRKRNLEIEADITEALNVDQEFVPHLPANWSIVNAYPAQQWVRRLYWKKKGLGTLTPWEHKQILLILPNILKDVQKQATMEMEKFIKAMSK